MKQQQSHVSGQPTNTSQRRRYLVAIILILAVGATLWILKGQGVLSTAWLTAIPWVVVGFLGVLMVWAVLWLLNDWGIIRGVWLVSALRVIRRIGPRVLLLAVLLFFLYATGVEIATTVSKMQGNWWDRDNIAALIQNALFPGFGFLLTFLPVYLIFQPPKQPELPPPSHSNVVPASQPPAPIIQVIVPPFSPTPLLPTPSGSAPALMRNLITTILPLTDSRTIEQREQMVRDIYQRLIDQDTNALVLTGIGGAGKSTLAALVCRFEERQRPDGKNLFSADPLWLTIDATATMAELAATLLDALGKPVPHVESFPPQQQAIALVNALTDTATPRLIVLDQFESLLNPFTGQVLPERLGISEWLEALNNLPSHCRIVLTSRLWPCGSHEYIPTRMREYSVERLTPAEGLELLSKQGVATTQATEGELQAAVERCQGHPLSLVLLASLLRSNRSLHLRVLLMDSLYAKLWKGKIAVGLLDYIYKQQLSEIQRKLLQAFSVYREAVPLDAVQALMAASPQEMLNAWEVLRAQHLLQDAGELRYQLHAIVGEYARGHFDERNDEVNQHELQEAHAKAATYLCEYGEELPITRGAAECQGCVASH